MDDKAPYTPETPQPQPGAMPGNNSVIYGAPNGVVGTPKKGLGRGRVLAIAGAATVLVLGAGGYLVGYYIPNRPANVYKTALGNTAKGYDQLVTYLDDKELVEKSKTYEYEGDFKVESADFATDGTFRLKSDSKNTTFGGDIGMGTTRVEVEGMAKDAANSDSPDLYLKVKGITGLGESFGMAQLDALNDQWIAVDHTFLDTYVKQIEQAGGIQEGKGLTTPKQEDMVDAAKAVGTVSKKYLFATDDANAVLEMKEFVGKEEVDGKSTNHYKVAADKANLKAFVKALGESLDKSKLNAWAKDAYGKNLSEVLNVEGMQKSVDGIKDGDTFDVWVNTKTKLVHKFRFTEKENTKNYFELGLNYDGGDEKPLFLNVGSETDGQNTTAKFVLTLNTATDAAKGDIDITTDDGESQNVFTVNLEGKPGTGAVAVEAPEGAISLSEALALIGLDGYLDLLTQSLSGAIAEQTATGELAPLSITQ